MLNKKYDAAIEQIKVGDSVTFICDDFYLHGYNSIFVCDIKKICERNVEFIANKGFIEQLKIHRKNNNDNLFSFFVDENSYLINLFKELNIRDWKGSMPIFKKVVVVKQEKHVENKKAKKSFQFSKNEIQNIQNEMIEKVDKKRFAQLLSIAGSYEVVNFCNKEVVNLYLKRWAENKWKFYILFGKQFYIKKEIKVEIDTNEMQSKIRDLCFLYPKYSSVLMNISTDSFIQNSMRNYSLYEEFCPVERGMKVSKFLCNLFNDDDFNKDLSILLQDKMIDSNLFISIDPYDFATMSISKSGWRSCHSIVDGEFCGGGLSYMMDNNSTIAYRANNNNYDYSFYNFKFNGNSKIWRQLVNIDTKSFSAIFGRQYPNCNKILEKEIRTLYEDCVDSFIDNKNESWVIRKNNINGHYNVVNESLVYYDVHCGYDFEFAYLKSQTDGCDVNFDIGSNILYDVYTCNAINSIKERSLTERL